MAALQEVLTVTVMKVAEVQQAKVFRVVVVLDLTHPATTTTLQVVVVALAAQVKTDQKKDMTAQHHQEDQVLQLIFLKMYYTLVEAEEPHTITDNQVTAQLAA